MLISLLLFLPIVFCLLLYFLNSRIVNTAVQLIYSVFFLFTTISFCFKKEAFTTFFAVDALNIYFLLILAILYFCISLYNSAYIQTDQFSDKETTYYTISVFLFICTMIGTILSQNLGLLWVFIEGTTICSGYLIYFNRTNSSLEAAWKYIFVCSIGIALAYVGIILLSISNLSLNSLFFSDLYANAASLNPLWLKLAFLFLLIGFGTKMGLAPVHAWLPDAHSESPSPISALLSGALLNAAFLAILRVYNILDLAGSKDFANILLYTMGFASLFVSAVFFFKVKNYKRMLAYSSIENMGIIVIGIATGGLGIFAALLHMLGHSLAKGSLFLTSGNILHIFKTKEIDKVSGLFKKDPISSWLWILGFLAIIGIPPSPIFLSDFLIIKAFFVQEKFIFAVVFLILQTVIIYNMAKYFLSMNYGEYDKKIEQKEKVHNLTFFRYIPQIILLLVLFAMGINLPQLITDLINSAVLFI